ncbi:MAG: hypothetical protein HOI59_05425 [Nitrospina sp.]|jgi:hypothetical protein|nr:hypothetical protein [Nitrospina sp.]MBT3857519.1 hypothetical protein [Nitrospina sp.]MBT4104615.1 hypothetical protein [Nitrospina sp.]MBT4388531.1 hypothetical protein [Nitrospina sp.]MBT4622027.1 hypothetical protein [Nitrospina sp.]
MLDIPILYDLERRFRFQARFVEVDFVIAGMIIIKRARVMMVFVLQRLCGMVIYYMIEDAMLMRMNRAQMLVGR